MKVLLVSSSSGSAGGGEIYLIRLAMGLSKLGHQVYSLCNASPVTDKLAKDLSRFSEVRRLEFLNTYSRPIRSLGAILDHNQQRRLTQAFEEISADVVHINQQVPEDGLDLVLAAYRSRLPFLSTIHIAYSAHELGARFGKLRDLVTSKILHRVNAVHITVAEGARNALSKRLNDSDGRRIRVVLNGVPPSEPNHASREEVRARWGVGQGEFVLGSVGRLDPQKAPMFALEIMAALRAKGLPIQYIWIGDGAMRTAFEERAQQLGIAHCVRLDGWRDDVLSCLQGLDVFVMPSRFEGMPLALLEAMSSGLCCCVSNVDGISEAVEHRVSGYLCAPQNLEEWCRQLEALCTNPEYRLEVGRKANAVARMRFGVESMARNTARVYEDVIRLHDRAQST